MPGYNLAALQSLANAQGLQKPADLVKLKRLSEIDVPNFVSEADQQKSETYLLHRQATKSIKKPLMRTKRKLESYQHQNITKELVDRVQCNEGAAVVQVLWNKEPQASSVRSEEKRVSEIEERDLLLGKAVQHQNLNTVWVLASKTSQARRDEALSTAMSLRDHAIIRKLLEYGANANHGHQHFTTAVAAADVAAVELILQAPLTGALHNQTLVDVLLLAVKNNSTIILWRVVSSADLNNIPEHSAVAEAAEQGRIDMLLVLLLSMQNLNSEVLGDLSLRVFNSPLLDSHLLDRTLHALLSAGAKGNGVASAFRLAIEKQSLPFIKLFAQYMVDVNWGEGRLVRCAIETMRPDILRLVLSSSPLSPENASRAVKALPDGVEPVIRREMMLILLNAGAYGVPLENELVTAVRDNDTAMIAILRGQGRPVNMDVSSALVAAVQAENVALLEQLLAGVSDQAALQAALPYVCGPNKVKRLEMTKLLVRAQVKGGALHCALIRAVCDDGVDRDDELVDVLIRAGADPSFNNAEVLRYVVDTGDSTLFKRLMKSPIQVSRTTISTLLTSICAIATPDVRYRFTVISLQARPNQHEVSAFLSTCLSEESLDLELIKLLITVGQPDINFERGELLEKATYLNDLEPLRQLVRLSGRTEDSTTQALARMFEVYEQDDNQTAQRVEILMCSGTHKAAATRTLEAFVDFWSRAKIEGGRWPLGTVRVLLTAGADFDSSPELANTIARCCATPTIQLFLQYKPSAAFIDAGLQGCIYVEDASNRDPLIGIFIDAGATREGISKSLVLACEHNLEDSCATLMQAGGDPRYDGHRPLRDTVAHGSTALLRILLDAEKSCTNVAFVEAKRTSDLNRKHAQFEVILAAGVPLHLINDYLVEFFHVVELDGRLIKLLLDNNADVHAQLNICFLRATLLNDLKVLSMLFGKTSNKSVVADRCLELCADQQLFKNDFLRLLSFLSSCTPSISVLNSALKQASHAVKNDATMRQLLPILLEAGADPNDDLGIVLNSVCERGDFETVAILTAKANIESRSRALHYLLQSTVHDKAFVKVLDSLTGLSNNSHPSFLLHADRFPPPLKTFLTKRPTSTDPLRRMLEHKCQALSWRDDDILFWGMQQTNVSDECLETLIRLGANVNFRDADSGQTVLLRAIKGKRRFVEMLLKHGANSSITDKNGMSPLLLSSHTGDPVVAGLLTKYGAPKNDGSLHHAVRKLDASVVEVLLKNGHDANHPSPTVRGRSPLAELFLCGKVDLTNHHAMGNVISSLLRVGADMKRPVSRKPLIYWAFDNTRPVQMVEGLMQAYLHRHIDADWNLIEDNGYIYSPTMWVQKRKFQGPHELGDQLLATLKNYGANRDVFYCLHGMQPDDATGLPPALAQQEAERKMREAEMAAVEAAHRREMQRIKEQETLRQKVQRERQHHELTLAAEAEAAKQHQLQARHVLEIEMQRERDDLTFQNMQRRLEIERQSRDDETRHLQNLKRLEYDSTQQKLALESKSRDDEIRQQQRLGGMAIENTKQRLALEATGESQRAAIRQRATDAEVAARQKLLKSEEHAGQVQHNRMMRQLEYAKAQPVGLPYKVPAGFITGP